MVHRPKRLQAKSREFNGLYGFHTLHYPDGSHYVGDLEKSRRNGRGTMYRIGGLVLDGEWRDGKLHGMGSIRKRASDRCFHRIYIGEFSLGKRHGEGRQFGPEGTYHGQWHWDKRHGEGIMWFEDGRMFVGTWRDDMFHGFGMLVYTNGDRYQGQWQRGQRHGVGIFFHSSRGQAQRGMWVEDRCLTSIMQDERREQAPNPTPYPIPEIRLQNPQQVICQILEQFPGSPSVRRG